MARFLSDGRVSKLGQGGAEVFGYASIFTQELAAIGQITPEQFAARFPAPPTTWPASIGTRPLRSSGPSSTPIRKFTTRPHPRRGRFSACTTSAWTRQELAVFKKNGFVVSERLGAPSCGEIFTRLWQDDLPVFIATDAILHAWHRSYDMMLAELEETYLFENVRQIIEGMASKVKDAARQAGNGPLKDSVRDADYFLTVAVRCSRAPNSPPHSARTSAWRQRSRQWPTCNWTSASIFSANHARWISLSSPRGHYTESVRLGRLLPMRDVAGPNRPAGGGRPFKDSSVPTRTWPHRVSWAPRWSFITCLKTPGQFDRWQQFDRMIQTFVGWTDSMTFGHLSEVLAPPASKPWRTCATRPRWARAGRPRQRRDRRAEHPERLV